MNISLRTFFCILIMVIAVRASAQSTGDKLFNEGLKLQQEGTSVSLNAAIKKFSAAKAVYTVAEKKKKCDVQVSKCRRMLKALTVAPPPEEEEVVTVQQPDIPTFSLKTNPVVFDAGNGFCTVSVLSNRTDWHALKDFESYDTEDFVKIDQTKDEKGLFIEVGENPKTTMRRQCFYIYVDDKGDVGELLRVIQKGKPVVMGCSVNTLEYGLKGGTKSLKIYTNSDSVLSSGLCWGLVSKPDWIELTAVDAKKLSKGKTPPTPGLVKEASMKLKAAPIKKGTPEYSTGRMGEIVFGSQKMRYKVIVVQK